MPHPKTPKTKKHPKPTADFPVMFYQSIPADKIKTGSANAFPPPPAPADLKKRQILMWAGVIIIMAFLIGLWGLTLKDKLSLVDLSSTKNELFPQKNLSDILQDNNQKINQAKESLKTAFQQILTDKKANAAASSSTAKLEELKKKIERAH